MRDAVVQSGKPSAVFHNYRFAPAVALAKKWIDEGRLGRIFHFRAAYLQDWIADPQFPRVWRLEKARTGSGALGDIGSHIIDLGRHLVGEIQSVVGQLETFVTERPLPEGGSGPVDVDDAAAMIARFASGALGTFEATRFAVGRKNANRFEINAEKGSLAFDLERMNELEFYSELDPAGERGFRTVLATDSLHPYAGRYWPVGHIIGYEHTFINLIAEALLAHDRGERFRPDIEDGYLNQRVLDAVERSAASKAWVNL
jgi:predicted dehydrogenase